MAYKILITCWDFLSPNNIGGNRWRKYASELKKAGHEIHIICKKNNLPQNSKNLNNVFDNYFLYTITPSIFTEWSVSYSNKIKLWTALVMLKIIQKGSCFDKAIAVKRHYSELLKDVVLKKNIQIVIVSGAPFNLLFYTALLKSNLTHVKFIADYRDPWINAENYGMKNLTYSRFKYETFKNNTVLENFDYITAPNLFLLQEIKKTYNGNLKLKSNFIELSHSYNITPDFTNERPSVPHLIKIIYGGTIYINFDLYLKNLALVLSKFIDVNVKLQVDFYTDQIEKKIYFSDLNFITFHNSNFDNFTNILKGTDFIFIFCADHNKNYLTSKFFDYLPYKKPFIYVGPKGFVSEFIHSNNLGVNIESISSVYDLQMTKKLSTKFNYNNFKSSFVVNNFINRLTIES